MEGGGRGEGGGGSNLALVFWVFSRKVSFSGSKVHLLFFQVQMQKIVPVSLEEEEEAPLLPWRPETRKRADFQVFH